MTDYDKVLQAIKELRPIQTNPLFRSKPASWWLDRIEEMVTEFKEKTK